MFLVNSHLESLAATYARTHTDFIRTNTDEFPHKSVFSPYKSVTGRSYCELTTAFLPSSLTKVLSYTLGFSPYSPVSVCGTATIILI